MNKAEEKALIEVVRLVHYMWLHGADTSLDELGDIGDCTALCVRSNDDTSHSPDCEWVQILKRTTSVLSKYVADIRMYDPIPEYSQAGDGGE